MDKKKPYVPPTKAGPMPATCKRQEYHIAFEVGKSQAPIPPGFIRAVKVTLELDLLPDDGNMPSHDQAKYRVDLTDHPLYLHLQQYIRSNVR